MTERFSIALVFALLAGSWGPWASAANGLPDVSVRKGSTRQYKIKLDPGSRIDYVVNWKFYGQEGTILVVRQLNGGYPGCVLYQLEGGKSKIIQGHPFCKWKGKPFVASEGNGKFIEFPIRIKQSADFQYIDSSLRLNFDSIRKRLCSYDTFYGANAATIAKCEKELN
ncbi:hypothetical protein [Cupriavidus sp. HPC(L)]|uniref:hypothetical protein n=1 Tax=Cupriavidus sp. HPC(L) TaxID=1217418 RepID=UPI0012EE1A73|nr:hypothetical protein [Cupriavidus sp. HPC(L)]